MNYRLQLIVGDSVSFFLEDWQAGGVEITADVAGLFDVPLDGVRLDEFENKMEDYGLSWGRLRFLDMVRFGLSDVWHWRGARWLETRKEGVAKSASNRLRRLLATDFRKDPNAQKTLLQLMQASAKTLGPPTLLDGEFARADGRKERIIVYQRGIIAYDRTPHPQIVLEAIAQVTSADPTIGFDSPDSTVLT